MNPRSAASRAPRGHGIGTDPLVDRLVEPVPRGVVLSIRSVVWFGAQLAAVTIGQWLVAGLYAVVAGIASAQTARSWRAVGVRPYRAIAGWGAVVVIAAALVGLAWAGVALLALVVAALVVAIVSPASGPVLEVAGATVRSALGPAIVGVAMVQVTGQGWSLVVMLVVLAAGYDLGCTVWSSDGAGPVVGRVAGMVTVVVLTVAATAVHTVLRIDPFTSTIAVVVFGVMAATLFPLGPMVASALLPAADAPAPALRRIDVMIVAAPVWMMAMWGYAG
jgi:hypothetical protein